MLGVPAKNCSRCPRLAAWREALNTEHPDWFNAPVPSFGGDQASLLIVGLAPGLNGANRTGRPFTGDYAGDLLYATLTKFGLAEGAYQAHARDGLILNDVRITNAVRCVPPQNKPLPIEIAACRPFLIDEISQLPRLRVILALGQIAYQQVVAALQLPRSAFVFRHGGILPLPHLPGETPIMLAASYHCSRYNTNTGRLTIPMFETVFAGLAPYLQQSVGRQELL